VANWLRRCATVRVTVTFLAVVVVAMALAASGVIVVTLLQSSLEHSIQTTLELRATDIADTLATGTPPAVLATRAEETSLAQVVDAGGRVIAATANIEGEAPIASFRPAGTEPAARTVDGLPIGDGQRFRVVALAASTPAAHVTVYVANSLATVDDAVGTLTRVLAVAFSVLLGLVALTTWRAVGRSLRPVEAIRGRFEDFSTAQLDRRVPEPPTSDEIGRLARTLNVALDRLEASAARQRRFIADASHELRSPLTTVRTQVEVARAHPETVDWNELCSELLTDVVRLEELVDDLLVLTRLDGPAPRDRGTVDLGGVVATQLGDGAVPSGVTVTCSCERDAVVIGDQRDLTRLVDNLVDNAVHHARSRVVVNVHRHENWIRLDVDDDGPGIPPQDRARVLEPFTRLDPARGRGGGSGLGLAIVRDIVRAHAATVEVTSSDLGGARFRVELPTSGALEGASGSLQR
jgi:signal transduction histidine kinase